MRVRAAIVTVFLGASVILLSGCSQRYEVRIPSGFAVSSQIDDLREALTHGGDDVPRRVAINPHEDETQLPMEICGGGEPGCRELVFADTGLERSIDEVVNMVAERPKVEEVVIATDFPRRSVCERFDAAVGTGSGTDSVSVSISCTSQGSNESLEQFVDRIYQRIDISTDVLITICGEASVDLIRRLGNAEGRTREEGGGVVPQLFLPGAGQQLYTAGYPVFASIAYDFASIFPLNTVSGNESSEVYVPLGVFRY